MANDYFDPRDPPDISDGHPLHDYLKPPPGLAKLATAQVFVAILIILRGVIDLRAGQPLTLAFLTTLILPAGLLAASGLALRERTAWGWWLTAALYYCVFFNLPVDLVLWTVRGVAFPLATHLVVFGLAVFVLAYLTRPEILRFIRFATPDGKPRRSVLISPALVGLGWSVVGLVHSLMTHRS